MNWQWLAKAMDQLSERDRRALKIAVAAGGLILVFVFVLSPWLDHWHDVSGRLAEEQAKLAKLEATQSRAAASVVPVLEMPQGLYLQRLLFEQKVNEQVKKAGIKIKRLGYRSKGKKNAMFKGTVLQLECQGSGKLDQVLNLLAGLNENPYLLALEQFDLKCGPEKKRQEMTVSFTVSTIAR